MTEAPDCCQVCGQSCRPLRCRQCQKAFYCSVDCQRRDWKAGHRRACAASKAEAAWKELHSLVASSSLETAQEDFHKASDEVKRLQKEQHSNRETEDSSQTQSTFRAQPPPTQEVPRKQVLPRATAAKQQQASKKRDKVSTQASVSTDSAPFCRFYVEDMAHLCCYQLTLQPMHPIPTDDLTISIRRKSDSTIVSIRIIEHLKIHLELPGEINSSPRAYPVDQAISIRLSYNPDRPSDELALPPLLSPKEACHLACRFCRQPLIRRNDDQDDDVLQQSLQLPSGRWDEMGDYLICYPGQPAVDFTSTSTVAQNGTVLQDETVVVLHATDVNQSACVLAVPNYGDDPNDDKSVQNEKVLDKDTSAVVRGSRPWRESVGGASLTCSQCCSVLGFAPIELADTFRFLQHRVLVAGEPDKVCTTVTSFVAHEMVRYAETKAIFSFIIATESTRKCLMLRLLSRDTREARSIDSELKDGIFRLKWHQMAKIIFEETVEAKATSNDDVWTWNNDWCCPPDKEEKMAEVRPPEDMPPSFVRLFLPPSEWKQVRDDLKQSSRLNSKQVVQATILSKTGRSLSSDSSMGLATVPL